MSIQLIDVKLSNKHLLKSITNHSKFNQRPMRFQHKVEYEILIFYNIQISYTFYFVCLKKWKKWNIVGKKTKNVIRSRIGDI